MFTITVSQYIGTLAPHYIEKDHKGNISLNLKNECQEIELNYDSIEEVDEFTLTHGDIDFTFVKITLNDKTELFLVESMEEYIQLSRKSLKEAVSSVKGFLDSLESHYVDEDDENEQSLDDNIKIAA